MAISKTLRGYQADLYRRVNRARNNGKDAVMLLPTGAGKTAIARNHCSHVLNHSNHTGIKRVIITTPQKQILAGFLRTNEEEWSIKGKHSSQKIDNVEIIEIDNKAIGDFLKGSSGGSIAISCIQSITNQRSNAFNPFEEIEDCSSILWVIDEAHHIEAEQTARVITEFKNKNGKILYLTATPFNANGALRVLNNPDIEIIHRSLGEHMKDGFAPELEMSYEMFDVSAGVQNDYGYFRSDATRMESWATCIANAYEKDNKPKALVVIPSFSRSGDGNVEDLDTENAANALKIELEKKIQGIKVLSAVGNDASGELSKKIELEANTFPGHDIIIACRRFDEGTDVPAISAVYLVGMTGCRRIIQLMGRALRNKSTIKGFSDKYPDYLTKSIFKFFIFNTTQVTDEDLEDSQYEFSLSAIKTINAVQNFRSYNVISGAVRVRRRLQERIETLLEDDPDSPDIELLEELVSEIEQPIIALETSGEKDDSMLALMAHSKMDHTNEEALENASETALAYIQSTLLSDELETDEDVEEFVERSITHKRRNRNANVINEELEELVTQYATEKVNYIESDLIKTFATSINRNTLEEWGDVLWNTYDNEERQLIKIKEIIGFYEENDRLPLNKMADDLIERKLAQKLGQLKTVYNHPGSIAANIYDNTLDYLKANNLLWILDNRDLETKQLNDIVDIVNFINTNNREPSQKSTTQLEKTLGYKLSRLRMVFTNKKTAGIVYDSTIDYLKSIDCLHLLNTKSNENIQLESVKELVSFIRTNNRTPSQTSENKLERSLGCKLSSYRMIHNGKDCNRSVLFPSSLDYLKSENLMSILKYTNYEERQLESAKKVIEFYRFNNRTPKRSSNNSDEKDLGRKLHLMKTGLKNRMENIKGNVIYDSTIDFFESQSLMHLIEPVDLVKQQLNQVKEIINFYNTNGNLPKTNGGDAEKKMGKKLSCLRAVYNGKDTSGGWNLYVETIDYLKSINMLHILEPQR